MLVFMSFTEVQNLSLVSNIFKLPTGLKKDLMRKGLNRHGLLSCLRKGSLWLTTTMLTADNQVLSSCTRIARGKHEGFTNK